MGRVESAASIPSSSPWAFAFPARSVQPTQMHPGQAKGQEKLKTAFLKKGGTGAERPKVKVTEQKPSKGVRGAPRGLEPGAGGRQLVALL